MAPFIARAILWFIFGYFLFYTTREFNKLFALSINPYFAIIPAVLVYGFQEFMLKKWKTKEAVVSTNAAIESKFSKTFFVLAWILIVGLFLCIVVVWAGVIYKEITRYN